MTNTHLHLAVALDGAGWHPAAWREASASPGEIFTPTYWVSLVQAAERGLLDFVTIEDSFALQSDDPFAEDRRTDRVRGRLDAELIAARVAPVTRHIGLVPTVVTSVTEPFHISKAIATIDYASKGRAGVRVQVGGRRGEAALTGRRPGRDFTRADLDSPEAIAAMRDSFGEAADYVEVIRRLWDSWEDDAEIRDAATGRFIDRDKLHYIDFEGRWFSVKGPSITPRPPQGQPIVAALAHRAVPFELVGRSADVGFVTPFDTADITPILAAIRSAQTEAGRGEETLHVFGDLVVVLGDTEDEAKARLARLDANAGAGFEGFTSDARVFVGTPAALADLLAQWHEAGLAGFRLRPAVLPDDLAQITEGLVPELQRRGLFRTSYPTSDDGTTTLRGLLGLPRPANRYATV